MPPGHLDIPAFLTRLGDIVDIPLVVRRYQRSGEVTRQSLNIGKGEKVALIQFGGHESVASWDEVCLPPGWVGVVIITDGKGPSLPGHFRGVSKETYIPDLVEAADVVVGKLGYGTCSEVISSDKSLVFVHRTNFNEEVGLMRLMKEHGCAVELSVGDFEKGKWSEAILEAEKAAERRREARRKIILEEEGSDGGMLATSIISTDGGKVSVEKLLGVISRLQ